MGKRTEPKIMSESEPISDPKQFTTLEDNAEAAQAVVTDALGIPPVQPGDGEVTGVPLEQTTGRQKSDLEIAIDKECAKVAAESHEILNRATNMVLSEIKRLHGQLEEVENMLLQGAADAKAQVSSQMSLTAEVAGIVHAVSARVPEMRRLAREVVAYR